MLGVGLVTRGCASSQQYHGTPLPRGASLAMDQREAGRVLEAAPTIWSMVRWRWLQGCLWPGCWLVLEGTTKALMASVNVKVALPGVHECLSC